ncbi:MAG: low molecular weight phosphatase family protein [Elusimicrobiota bacterium]|jgi:protein-tyrosine-phosphatase
MPPSILFVCRHNACRSQIAEAIGRKLAPGSWIIDSAGAHPTEQVDPKAVEILKLNGLKMRRSNPQGFPSLPLIRWDYVADISCEESGEKVPAKNYIEWDLPDPLDGPMDLYALLFRALEDRISSLFNEIRKGSDVS